MPESANARLKRLLVSKGPPGSPGEGAVAPPKARKPSTRELLANREKRTLRRKKWSIVGMDISASRLGMVALTEPIRVEKVDFDTPWTPTVCAHAQLAAMEWVAALQNELDWNGDVWIEAPLVAQGRVRGTIVQAFVSGAIQSGLITIGSRVTLITVQEWKQLSIGNGSASKELVAKRLRSRWPDDAALLGDDGDLLDALGVAHAGASRRAVMG